MEESACHKIVFDFNPTEMEFESSRKRTSSQMNDETSECSKKIRKQLQDIDLSSETSSMDTDDDEFIGNVSSSDTSKNSSVSDVAEAAAQEDQPIPSTSTAVTSSGPKVNIISIDIIKPVEETEAIEIPDENGNDVNDEVDTIANETVPVNSKKEEDSVQKSIPQKKQPETNRILISDSSDDDDETQNDTTNINSRRHSDGPSASSYSFTNVNGNTFESRASYDGGRHHHSHRFRRGGGRHHGNHNNFGTRNFQDQAREFQRAHTENTERIHENARLARDHAARAVRASASAIPDLVSTFQAHFRRPMFRVADINQQLFGSFNRR